MNPSRPVLKGIVPFGVPHMARELRVYGLGDSTIIERARTASKNHSSTTLSSFELTKLVELLDRRVKELAARGVCFRKPATSAVTGSKWPWDVTPIKAAEPAAPAKLDLDKPLEIVGYYATENPPVRLGATDTTLFIIMQGSNPTGFWCDIHGAVYGPTLARANSIHVRNTPAPWNNQVFGRTQPANDVGYFVGNEARA